MGIQSLYGANYFGNVNFGYNQSTINPYQQQSSYNYNSIFNSTQNSYQQQSPFDLSSIFSMLLSALFGQNTNSALLGQNSLNLGNAGVNINNTGNIGNINIDDLFSNLVEKQPPAVTKPVETPVATAPVAVDQTTVEVKPKTTKEMTDEELRAAWEAAGSVPNDECGTELHNRGLSDPYELNIDGKKFMFVKDANNNGKVDGKQEILGNNDKKDNLFADMKLLDTDRDGKVSAEELKAAKVSLNEVLNGQLTVNKFDIDKIDKLDLSSFKAVDNKKETGTFGTFTVQLKNGDMAEGAETFEDQKYFDKLLKK